MMMIDDDDVVLLLFAMLLLMLIMLMLMLLLLLLLLLLSLSFTPHLVRTNRMEGQYGYITLISKYLVGGTFLLAIVLAAHDMFVRPNSLILTRCREVFRCARACYVLIRAVCTRACYVFTRACYAFTRACYQIIIFWFGFLIVFS